LWPINEAVGRTPTGWPGWPGQKQFALILTHDVEKFRGVERVRQLAELEMEYGFRSSFNFVPEGGYEIPASLRTWLVQQGFEVGIQDLHHDGKLYRSRNHFRKNAERINHYLREWNAVGFRSAYMFHNLDWLHDLNIQYDTSTFDADPFEPQPDGMDTIFPFWVSRGDSEDAGYVELPYTLVQDFNLFSVLEEKTIDIWKRKLAWIVARGGMALLDTHPDYMAFEPDPVGIDEYPVERYRQWLEHIRTTYEGQYWHALPLETANFYKSKCVKAPAPARGRACMISYSFYEADNRVRRYAEALVKSGHSVDAFSLLRKEGQPAREVIDGVMVHRLQKRTKDERTPLQHLLRQLGFWFRSADLLLRSDAANTYRLIHVHNPPDFMVFAAAIAKWHGAKIILDIHDIVPELYENKFPSRLVHTVIGALKWVEKLSMRFADHVIVSNHLWHQKIVERSAPIEKTSVFINNVDPAIFFPHSKTKDNGKFTAVFPGSISWHQGLDLAIRALARIKSDLPNAEFHVYGVGHAKPDLLSLVSELNLGDKVFFHEMVPLHEVPQIMADADVGIVPKRADSFGNEAYSTKIMEFMSQGIPAIVSRTKIDDYYFDDSVVCFFEPSNVKQLADAILRVATDEEYRNALRTNALEYADRNSWDRNKARYLDLVDSLVSGSPLRTADSLTTAKPVNGNPDYIPCNIPDHRS
jgi:glycosyltransferase involved in cell wall biosynthesis